MARAQNWINPLPSGMAETYFHICTSEEWREITGRLFNHKRELVQPSSNEKGLAQVGNIFGTKTYPAYASDARNLERMRSLSVELTGKEGE
ncbi:hypothetical protein [Paenibacillus solani]|uniref:hypothetical protein n=1 Tax=Paenibacillus solani TaxID=1705565 RepID=UPI003D2DF65D